MNNFSTSTPASTHLTKRLTLVSDAQTDRVVYRTDPKVKYGYSGTLIPYTMDQRSFDFNEDGLANFGLIPDMLQDLKNLRLPANDFEALFTSAESYLRTWEKALRVARH